MHAMQFNHNAMRRATTGEAKETPPSGASARNTMKYTISPLFPSPLPWKLETGNRHFSRVSSQHAVALLVSVSALLERARHRDRDPPAPTNNNPLLLQNQAHWRANNYQQHAHATASKHVNITGGAAMCFVFHRLVDAFPPRLALHCSRSADSAARAAPSAVASPFCPRPLRCPAARLPHAPLRRRRSLKSILRCPARGSVTSAHSCEEPLRDWAIPSAPPRRRLPPRPPRAVRRPIHPPPAPRTPPTTPGREDRWLPAPPPAPAWPPGQPKAARPSALAVLEG